MFNNFFNQLAEKIYLKLYPEEKWLYNKGDLLKMSLANGSMIFLQINDINQETKEYKTTQTNVNFHYDRFGWFQRVDTNINYNVITPKKDLEICKLRLADEKELLPYIGEKNENK